MRLKMMTNVIDFHTSFFYMLNNEPNGDKLHEYMSDFFVDPPIVSKRQKCGKNQLMDLMGKFNKISIIIFFIYFFLYQVYKIFFFYLNISKRSLLLL